MFCKCKHSECLHYNTLVLVEGLLFVIALQKHHDCNHFNTGFAEIGYTVYSPFKKAILPYKLKSVHVAKTAGINETL